MPQINNLYSTAAVPRPVIWMNKTCIIITGPTAVGKTAVAIGLAQHLNTQIISADSRQCFRELNIGVAKPSAEELSLVPHHFIDSHSIQETFSAADYEQYALGKLSEVFKQHDTAVMVGGTGLYIKAFCEGLDLIPAIPAHIKQELLGHYEQAGMEWLQSQLEKHDPDYFSSGEMQNPQRMMRALEVVLHTGKSIRSFQTHTRQKRDFNIIKIGLEMPRELLYSRINERVDKMLEEGLLAEVEALVPYKSLNALQTVGYKEMFEYVDGNATLNQSIELIKQHTRHYAKRQLTWFKKDTETHWIDARFQKEALLQILSLV